MFTTFGFVVLGECNAPLMMQFQIALSGLFLALVAELVLEQGPEFAKGFEA